MKYIFDLDDTLINSTPLNNDAYNYALEKFGYPRINTDDRITREKLTVIPATILQKVIIEKQKYFISEWLPYRTIANYKLIESIVRYGKENCYLWTKASKRRVESILKYYNIDKLFKKVVYDDKSKFNDSIQKLNEHTHCREFIIYENNHQFFDNEHVTVIDRIKTYNFDVVVYHICS